MKHAYLILAHHEFAILQELVTALDDDRNAIFIHIDRKVQVIPELRTIQAELHFVPDAERIDIRWGHFSQIEAELALFTMASSHGPYSYYHVISGVTLPLKNQDEIHRYFATGSDIQYFIPLGFSKLELEEKGNMINMGMRNFAKSRSAQIWRQQFIRFQRRLGIRVNADRSFMKAANWVSITQDAVDYLLGVKQDIFKKYRYTMCGDELFIPTELHYSNRNWTCMYSDELLYQEMDGSNARELTLHDFDAMVASRAIFARKFSVKEKELVKKVLKKIKEDA